MDWEIAGLPSVVTPAGFVSDGPTIPRIFWIIIPVWGRWGAAGVLHDYLCCRLVMLNPHPAAPTRVDADRLFLAAMKALGVGWFPRYILFLGVRIGAMLRLPTTMWQYNKNLPVMA